MRIEYYGTIYLSFVSLATNPLEGTWTGTCADDEAHKFVIDSDFNVLYYVEGAIVSGYSDLVLDISNYPTSAAFANDDETYKVTIISETSFKVNMSDDCKTITYTKQLA